jgi:hypothetical protein
MIAECVLATKLNPTYCGLCKPKNILKITIQDDPQYIYFDKTVLDLVTMYRYFVFSNI